MTELDINVKVRVYEGIKALTPEDAVLMQAAKAALVNSYSPYSQFKVAAAVLLESGEVLTGTNQENASYPAGICAEGTVLSAVSAMQPNVAVKKMAVTVKSGRSIVSKPVAPCGICRQRIYEYEMRFNADIEIIMMGEEGEVYRVKSIKDLLPLAFFKM